MRLQIATDITERKATEDIVRQQQEKVQLTSRLMTMGEMASSLAHELNQPLTAISNYSLGTVSRIKDGGASVDDVLEPSRFFGADPSTPWKDNARTIGDDVPRFLDTEHTVATIMREYRLREFRP